MEAEGSEGRRELTANAKCKMQREPTRMKLKVGQPLCINASSIRTQNARAGATLPGVVSPQSPLLLKWSY